MSGASHDDDGGGMVTDAGEAGLEGDRLCTGGDTTPVMGAKRKGVPSPPPLSVEGDVGRIEAGLAYIRSTLKSAMTEARAVGVRSGSDGLIKSLENIFDTVSQMLTRKGKLRTPLYPVSKKPRSLVELGSAIKDIGRPEMVDVGTDTVLTPNWWESEQERRKKESTRRRSAKAGARGPSAVVNHADTGAESAMETDGEGWREVVGRKATAAPHSGRAMGLPIRMRTGVKLRTKPPTVLVKVAAGSSSGYWHAQTRDGHLLVELAKGAGSVVAAQKLSSAIATRLGDAVGGVSQLSQFTVVEIVDLDAVTTEGKVLLALRTAIHGSEDDQAAICKREAVQITGLWSTRSGQQIATARMTRASAAIVIRVPIGWTMCHVRPRRPEPEKCFRCHGFGHRSDNCSGPDLSLNCRRCGESGLELKECLADKDRCVACERAGIERFEHKPGSGMCKAKKEALKILAGHNSQAQSRREASGDGTRSKQ
ncbi:hypothetical protein QTP88_014192 [Uroleucon formosanum]